MFRISIFITFIVFESFIKTFQLDDATDKIKAGLSTNTADQTKTDVVVHSNAKKGIFSSIKENVLYYKDLICNTYTNFKGGLTQKVEYYKNMFYEEVPKIKTAMPDAYSKVKNVLIEDPSKCQRIADNALYDLKNSDWLKKTTPNPSKNNNGEKQNLKEDKKEKMPTNTSGNDQNGKQRLITKKKDYTTETVIAVLFISFVVGLLAYSCFSIKKCHV